MERVCSHNVQCLTAPLSHAVPLKDLFFLFSWNKVQATPTRSFPVPLRPAGRSLRDKDGTGHTLIANRSFKTCESASHEPTVKRTSGTPAATKRAPLLIVCSNGG